MATPPVFTAGSVLTAAQMNAVGLWLVKTVTVGSAVSYVDVTSAFSSDYDNYMISYSNIDSSANAVGIFFRFGTNASPVTTNYSFAGLYTPYSGAVGNIQQTAPGYWEVAGTNTTNTSGQFFVSGPNLAAHSYFNSHFSRTDSALTIAGVHQATTQHTGFYLYPTSGTLTGGTIRVFGIRN